MLGLGSSILAPTYLGASYIDGFSIDVDGADGHLTSATFSKEALKSGMSCSAWFKMDAHDSNNGFIIGGWGAAAQTFRLLNLASGYIQFGVRLDNNGFRKVANTDNYGGDGNWHHAVGTFTKNGNITLYIDGDSIGDHASGSDRDLQVTDSNSDNSGTVETGVSIGAKGNFSTEADFFHGHINDVGIWNEALDADAVAAIYNSGTPTDLTVDDGNYDNSDTLVSYWKFEEGTGTTVADSGTNNKALTLVNHGDGSTAFSTDTP